MDKKLSKLLAAAFAVALAVGIFALTGCSSSNTNSDNLVGVCRHFNRTTYHVSDRLSAGSRCLIGIRVR